MERLSGSFGSVSISYQTQAISATSGQDYLPASGTLRLDDGQEEGMINVTLLDDLTQEFAEEFSVTLSGPEGQTEIFTCIFLFH